MTSDLPGGTTPGDDDELDASDEALSWDGERDASHVAGPAPLGAKPGRAARPGRTPRPGKLRPAASPTPASPTPGSAAQPGSEEQPGEDRADAASVAPLPASSFLLVSYGILGGVYALYTVGWITTVLRSSISFSDLLGEFMYQLGEFFAIAAAPVWFAAVFVFTRNAKPLVRLLWLLLGLVLLVPVPFVLGV
jgi:hypothetical protein